MYKYFLKLNLYNYIKFDGNMNMYYMNITKHQYHPPDTTVPVISIVLVSSITTTYHPKLQYG